MMSTIAGEGTNSDGREVTTTAQEREKTDAGMTGTTGEKERCGEARRTVSHRWDSAKPHAATSSPNKNLQNAAKWWLSGALTLSESGD